MKCVKVLSVFLGLLFVIGLTGCRTARPHAAYGMLDSDGDALTASYEAPIGTDPVPEPEAMDLVKPKNRLMIYHGSIALVVDNIAENMNRTRGVVEKAGGYMQSLRNNTMILKIPAAKFTEIIAEIEALGEVASKSIVGEDVTDRMRDLRIRLKNATQIRDRLAALLEKAEKVEEALEIERELGRVTENIELLKGQIQAMENQIAFSTLTVRFNSPLPQQTVKQEIPFPWVLELGADLVTGTRTQSHYHRRRGRGRVRFDLPKSFAKYEDRHYRTRALSADGVLLKVARHTNVEGGDLTFWTTFVKKSLSMQRAILVKRVDKSTVYRGKECVILEGVKEIGGKPYAYLVAIAVTKNHVVTYEAWGPADAFESAKTAIKTSIGTVRP